MMTAKIIRRRALFVAIIGSMLLLIVCIASFSQNAPSQDSKQEPVLRVAVNEVLLDVVVTDKKGKQIRDLRPEEFEVFEDGKPQTLISLRTPPPAEPENPDRSPSVAPARITASGGAGTKQTVQQMGVVAMVFDRISPSGRKLAADAALQYAREFGATDYVSVMIVDRKLRILTPFTADQARLQQAIQLAMGGTPQQFLDAARAVRDAIRKWQESSAAASAAVAAAGSAGAPGTGVGAAFAEAAFNRSVATIMRQVSVAEEMIQGTASIEALLQIVKNMREFPGRKAVMYFAEQMALPTQVAGRFRDLISASNRANVSFYCVDATGLDPSRKLERMGQELASLSQVSQGQMAKTGREAVSRDEVMLSENVSNVTRSVAQENLADLAQSTGGTLVANTNDLKRGVRSVADDLRFHYELIYTPTNQNYDGAFRKVEIKVKRSGMVIRSREGYYAFRKDDATDAQYEIPLFAALKAASLPNDLSFRSAALQFPTESAGSDTVLYTEIPLSDFSFVINQQKKEYNARISVLTAVRNGEGKVVEKFSQEFPLQGPAEKAAETSKKIFGFYRLADLAPGRYTVEAVVRDPLANKIGARRTSLVVPRRDPQSLMVGSIVMVKYLDDAAADTELTETPLMYINKMVIPNLNPNITKTDQPNLSFFFIAVGATNAESTADLFIARDGKTLGHTGEQKLPTPDARGRIRYVASLPLANFPQGNYDLDVVLKQGQNTASGKLGFTVQ